MENVAVIMRSNEWKGGKKRKRQRRGIVGRKTKLRAKYLFSCNCSDMTFGGLCSVDAIETGRRC